MLFPKLQLDCSADIPELVYNKSINRGPEIINQIVNAPAVRSLVESKLREEMWKIISHYNAKPTEPYETKIDKVSINLREIILGQFILNDLGLAYGYANVSLYPVIAYLENQSGLTCVKSVHVTGEVTDLYDWKWFQNDLFGKRAAVLQVGYGANAVLGVAGNVFNSKVEIDSDMDMAFCFD